MTAWRAPAAWRACATAALILAAAPGHPQPRASNASVTERGLDGSLRAAVRQIAQSAAAPLWVAWEAAAADPESRMCCGEGWSDARPPGAACSLEPGAGGAVLRRDPAAGTSLEPAETFFVFARLEGGAVERVRIFSADCPLDGRGRGIVWLTKVPAAESVSFLASLAEDDSASRRAAQGALVALSQHAAPEAVARLIRLARTAAQARVRGDALFWLSQRASSRIEGVLADAAREDPETDVKKRAVFALSQLPAGQGIPRLVEIARTHPNTAVRRQAMFWLGQSKDPRALAFFEEVLR